MPPQPLYSEPANIPGSTNFTTPQIHTHSNKFPIEREVILCNSDKNSKIPILNDYHRKIQKSSVAPDAPNVQIAWMDNRANTNCYESRMLNTPGNMMNETIHVYKAKPLSPLNTEGTDPSPILPTNVLQTSRDTRFHSTPEMETSTGNNKTFPSRTYNTIKDMISSRFNKNKVEVVNNGLNNNNGNKDISKQNDSLSPLSQLKQRGVYLGQLRSQSTVENRDISEWRSPNETTGGGIRYRERGIDVEHSENNRSKMLTTAETPKRTQTCISKTNGCTSNRLSEYVPNEELDSTIGPSCMYSHRIPSQISGEQEKRSTYKNSKPTSYGVKEEPDNLVRTRSNDYLLEGNSSKDVKMRSRSFENILNSNRQENGPCEIIGGATSDHDRHRHSDSGRGSTVYSSGKINRPTDTSPDSSSEPHRTNNRDTQWTDTVPTELKQILEPDIQDNSTLSDSSASPPLPPDDSSDGVSTPVYKGKSLVFGSKGDRNSAYRGNAIPSSSKGKLWQSRNNCKEKIPHRLVVTKRPETQSKISSTVGSSSLDLDSMLDDNNYTSEEDISTTDAMTIRKQLEGLENMYSEVLKLLGVRKSTLGRYQPSDPRISKRRVYGSMSSLPSSVSSRPIRDRYRRYDDRKKTVRDVKGINKRFQRLESHVVTLARSVAHLSSEMRTQHLMIQEMEVIRGELSSLRAQTNALSYRSQSVPRLHVTTSEQTNSSPDKLKKLTKFFGDEPPLLRLFLKKLGYEKYANTFEKERIGLVELPYMSEERLQKLGIPMGPRLRIMQEAQLGFPGAHENTLCIV